MLALPLRTLVTLVVSVAVLTTAMTAWSPASAQVRAIDQGCPAGILPSRFLDVFDDGTHTEAIDCVYFWDITRGTGPERYSPASGSTRGQMAAFLARLVRASEATLPTSSPDAFDDDDGTFSERDIDLLAELGIVTGRGGRSYDPLGIVRRDQMATFLVRTYEFIADSELPAGGDAFSDDDGNTHEARIDQAAAAGFAAGVDAQRYVPSAVVRRDQMATFLSRVLDALVEGGRATLPPVPELDPACYEDEVAAATCEFVLALQSSDGSTLSEQERQVGAELTGSPPGAWYLDGCELAGDITVECQVVFDEVPVHSDWTVATVFLQPANGEYDPETGGVDFPAGEEVRYGVVGYTGAAESGRSMYGSPPAGQETGRAPLQHQTWGPVTVRTSVDDAADTVSLSVVDAAGGVLFRRDWAWGSSSIALNDPHTDATGNVFVTYNPGRYDGVIVLRPVPYGLESFGSLPGLDDYVGAGPFGYYAEAVDDDGDGLLDILQHSNDCDPSCAGGTVTTTRFAWTGTSYEQS